MDKLEVVLQYMKINFVVHFSIIHYAYKLTEKWCGSI